MELKGRITKAGPLETRQRKSDGSDYTAFDLHVQIGLYERTIADYRTQTFTKTMEADEVGKTYFHDDARAAAEKFRQGEVVMVTFHHYVNQYGRTETVIDTVEPVNATKAAEAQTQAPAADPAESPDNLPF